MKYKKLCKIVMIISMLLFPCLVFASSGENDISIGMCIGIEAFVTIHMSVFVLKPLSEMFSKDNSTKTFLTLFIIRAVFLLICDFFVTPWIFMVDFIAVFVGAFLVVPICALITKSKNNGIISQTAVPTTVQTPQEQIKGIELRCAKCNSILQITDKNCKKCGEPFDGNNVVVSENANATIEIPKKVAVSPSDFNPLYSLSDNEALERFIIKELEKVGMDKSSALMPSDLLKRKKILNVIFEILLFAYITLIFFHFPLYTYIIGIIILFIFLKITRKYNFIKYLKKQIKARPGEKISNIIIYEKNNLLKDNTKSLFIIGLFIAVVAPLIIFSTPKIFYEKTSGGYAVRYYAFGLTNYKTAVIPEYYKNEKVVGLRGNTFSNMRFLKSVKLPDSIVEIRGQAFKNCSSLSEVNIPKNLEYLGGGAFYNAKSIKKIELPDTLTYLGGESFYGAKSLEYIRLSNSLAEIRGDSFEYCTSLKSITVPDSVTRIGGHAFYGDNNLSEVTLTENSKLSEIGSSAFRQCSNLYTITIPRNTYVNERAFKESPTRVQYFNYHGNDYNKTSNNYISNSNQNVINMFLDENTNYSSDFYKFGLNYYNTKIVINGNNTFKFSSGKLYSENEIYVSGSITNYNYLNAAFDLKILYYDKDYSLIGQCNKNIDLIGRAYGDVSFLCQTAESELSSNKNANDVAYYKLNFYNYKRG